MAAPSNRATVPGKLYDPFDCVEQSANALLTASARDLQGADAADQNVEMNPAAGIWHDGYHY
jgi:hypothetical protein